MQVSINPGGGAVTVYFGEWWDVPAMESARLADTPVGALCRFCDVKIVEGDQGVFMVHVDLDAEGNPSASAGPWHRECQLRSVLGSVDHLEGRCICRDGDGGQHEAATPREEALRLRAWLVERGRW